MNVPLGENCKAWRSRLGLLRHLRFLAMTVSVIEAFAIESSALTILERASRGNPDLVSEGEGQSPDLRAKEWSDLSSAKSFGTFQKVQKRKRLVLCPTKNKKEKYFGRLFEKLQRA